MLLALEIVLHVVLAVGLVCNAVGLCVILRMDIRKPDLSLALVMVASDLLLTVFKLGESFVLSVLGGSAGGQWKGVVSTGLLQLSAVSIGFLAVVRFWVIVLRRRVDLRVLWTLFVIPQLVVLGLLIAVARQGQFQTGNIMSVMYPGINTGSSVVEACRYTLLLCFAWPVVAANISYPCIARLYGSHLALLEPGEMARKKTRLVYLKIAAFVLLYNLAMAPCLIDLILEAITRRLQSPVLDAIAVIFVFAMTIFNPIVMLTLHDETFQEYKGLLNQLREKLGWSS